jgi:hypothetical protein
LFYISTAKLVRKNETRKFFAYFPPLFAATRQKTAETFGRYKYYDYLCRRKV